ncbi:serine/threonine-protein kinase [Tetraselmis virus 1]|uniref:Serine/threonine-protein kinase n=1 Tax=Tetraselmis virus 1 TaxID=2060617 RepID=A0A2P0VNJ1_9VIRU|nr:serine/threonine-protein kinase [Tetraselmis virus 1]AUF82474.1 serine/threonine-protein kinase [Tetraselmis virus 1]
MAYLFRILDFSDSIFKTITSIQHPEIPFSYILKITDCVYTSYKHVYTMFFTFDICWKRRGATRLEDPEDPPIEEVRCYGKSLGKGATAEVTEAIMKDGSSVALKIFKKSEYDDLRYEYDICKNLDPRLFVLPLSIIDVHVHGDTGEKALKMNLMKGGSLIDFLEKGITFSEKDIKKTTKRLLMAIKSLHDNNIVHRDIKPDNVLIENPNDFDSVKLCDMGFALKLSFPYEIRKCAGTLHYIAPEVVWNIVKNENYYSFPVDLWGLGLVIYAMYFGKSPFNLQSKESIFKEVIEKVPNTFGMPDGMEDLVKNLLIKIPENRFTADEALSHYWFQ